MMAQTGSNLAFDNVTYFFNPSTQQLRITTINDQQVFQQQRKKDEIIITIPNLQDQIRNLNLQLLQEKLQELKNRIEYFVLIDFDPISSWRNEYQKCLNYFNRINNVKEKYQKITEIIASDLELILSCIYNKTEQQYIKDLDKLLQIIQIQNPEKLKLVGQFKPWMSGFGMIQFPQGHKIIGEISFAHLCGRGVFITSKNMIFQGTFQNNRLQGLGTVIRSDGMKIEGIFENSQLQSGKIKFTHQNGKIVEANLNRKEKNKLFSFSDFRYNLNDSNQTVFETQEILDNERPPIYTLWRNKQIVSKVDKDGKCEGWVINLHKDQFLISGFFNKDGILNNATVKNLSGQLIKSGNFSDGKLNGKGTKFYHATQNIFESGTFSDDNLEGDGQRYYDGKNAQIKESGTFKKGVLNGKGQKYYQNGQIMEQGMFEQGLLVGQGVKFYQNGKIMQRGFFNNGMLEGEGEKRYENGACEEYGIFLKGELHSLDFQSAKAHPNEQYSEVGYFQDGQLSGQGTIYFDSGNKKEEGEFVRGELKQGTKYYQNGNKKEEGAFENGQLNCQGGRQYYEDGNIKSQGNYQNGLLQGSGNKYFSCYEIKGIFSKGEVSGTATFFNHSIIGQNSVTGAYEFTKYLILAAKQKELCPANFNPFG